MSNAALILQHLSQHRSLHALIAQGQALAKISALLQHSSQALLPSVTIVRNLSLGQELHAQLSKAQIAGPVARLINHPDDAIVRLALEGLSVWAGVDGSQLECIAAAGCVDRTCSLCSHKDPVIALSAVVLLEHLANGPPAVLAELQRANVVQGLLPLLDGATGDILQHAAVAVQRLCGSTILHPDICRAGGVAALGSHLSSHKGKRVKRASILALAALTEDPQAAETLALLPHAVAALYKFSTDSKLQVRLQATTLCHNSTIAADPLFHPTNGSRICCIYATSAVCNVKKSNATSCPDPNLHLSPELLPAAGCPEDALSAIRQQLGSQVAAAAYDVQQLEDAAESSRKYRGAVYGDHHNQHAISGR